MKNSLSNVKHRREMIAEMLSSAENQTLEVNELAIIMKVSAMTIRRDLDVLEKMGKVIRGHGDVRINKRQPTEGDTENLSLERIKSEIAKHAATYIDDHMTIFINSSSTALGIVDYIEDKSVTIVTNNLRVNRKNVNPNTNIMLTGGEIRFPKEALVGDLSVSNLSAVHSDIAIMGCSGITAEKGISTFNIHEAKVNEVMIDNTDGLVIVLADYRKIDNNSSFIVSDISKIDILLTDTYSHPSVIQEFEAKGVKVIQVEA